MCILWAFPLPCLSWRATFSFCFLAWAGGRSQSSLKIDSFLSFKDLKTCAQENIAFWEWLNFSRPPVEPEVRTWVQVLYYEIHSGKQKRGKRGCGPGNGEYWVCYRTGDSPGQLSEKLREIYLRIVPPNAGSLGHPSIDFHPLLAEGFLWEMLTAPFLGCLPSLVCGITCSLSFCSLIFRSLAKNEPENASF